MDKDYRRIVNSYADILYRIAIHYTKNSYDAQDIVQQVFLKLVEKDIDFQNAEHEKAWLIRVCVNLCKDISKSSWSKKVTPSEEIHIKEYSEYDEENYSLLEYIRTLPPKQKTAIYLFYYEDMSVKEISTAMDAGQNTVLSWLNRGRKTLKKILTEEL